jgi:hypothetical protein
MPLRGDRLNCVAWCVTLLRGIVRGQRSHGLAPGPKDGWTLTVNEFRLSRLNNADFVPPKAISTVKIDQCFLGNHNLSVQAITLVDLDVNVELALVVEAVNSQKWLVGTDAAKLVLRPPTRGLQSNSPVPDKRG